MRFPWQLNYQVTKYLIGKKLKGEKKFPLVLMLEPTHVCNLKCEGCGRIREYSDTLGQMVSLEECLKVADDCGAPVISICGGEPLLYPQIGELVRELVDRKKHIYLCTNALQLEKKLDLFTPSPHFNINIHLDGMAKTHDLIVNRPGVFEIVLKSIKTALSNGFRVYTNTTIYQETDLDEIEKLFTMLDGLKISGIMVAPGFEYSTVRDKAVCMNRNQINEKFRKINERFNKHRFANSPLYLDFLAGVRDYPCTPWGNVTYTPRGWKSPCYLITDEHYESFQDFMEKTDWENYGYGKDERCEHCMVHCGYETTVTLQTGRSLKDIVKMMKWNLS